MDAETPGLLSNFLEYFNDNVSMMAMAATIGAVGGGLAGKAVGPHAGNVAQGQAEMLVCIFLISGLRLVGLWLYRRAPDGSVMRTVYGTMLLGLPWFLRVPMVDLLPIYLNVVYDKVGWDYRDVNNGQACIAFILNMVMFAAIFAVLVLLASLARSLPDAAQPDAKWSTFYVQSFYLAFLSGAGKTLHYAALILNEALAGPIHFPPRLQTQVAVYLFILFLTAACWFVLSSTLPNQMTNPLLAERPFTQTSLMCQQYVVVYTWAYAVVNIGWREIYNQLGGVTSHALGLFLFYVWLLVHLAFAWLLAAGTPDKNFYDMGKGRPERNALCLMNYWLVDFITWWAQAQVVTTLDVDLEELGKEGTRTQSSWLTIVVNLFYVLALLLFCGGLHACNHEALLSKAEGGWGHKHHAVSYIPESQPSQMCGDRGGSSDSEDDSHECVEDDHDDS